MLYICVCKRIVLKTCVASVNSTHNPCSDEPRCADLLVQNGADINSRNSKGATPVMIAATKGCRDILRILTRQPSVRLAEQVLSLHPHTVL